MSGIIQSSIENTLPGQVPGYAIPNPIDYSHPVVHIQYRYKHDFLTVAQAFVRKFNYENRLFLNTVTGVEQLDEDRIQFYRREESSVYHGISYERVIVNRATKEVTSELVDETWDKQERLYERSTLSEDGSNVLHKHLVFDDQGIKSLKLSAFNLGVNRLLKTIRFTQFEAESQ
jgi:hypothetical protein